MKVEDMLTSELIYRNEETEFERRMDLLGLVPEQRMQFWNREKQVFRTHERQYRNSGREWSRLVCITDGMTKEELVPPEWLSLSELILLTDDANSAFWRDHEWLSDKTWEVVMICGCQGGGEARYAYYCYKVVNEELGWIDKQKHFFIEQENLLIARIKWQYHHERMDWVKKLWQGM